MRGSLIEKQSSRFLFTSLWNAEGLAAQSCHLILPLEGEIAYDKSGVFGFKMLKLFLKIFSKQWDELVMFEFLSLFFALNLNNLMGPINVFLPKKGKPCPFENFLFCFHTLEIQVNT